MIRMRPGPPGQVAAVAGKKDGGKQGEAGGILKELGYTADQVKISHLVDLYQSRSVANLQ
jgi:hypothetical protein